MYRKTFNTTNMKKSIFFLLAIIGLAIPGSCKKDQPDPTSLEINVIDELGNIVSGASVELYSSENDWNNATNQIGKTLISDALGIVTFDNVSNIKYYWYAEKDCKNNVNGAITSAALTANMKTKVNVVITSTGTFMFVNASVNPYRIYINGISTLDMNGGTSQYMYYMPIGAYVIRVLQLSGYSGSPTDKTYTGTLNCGSTLVTTFP
jgi:hypothetical protein